MRSRRAAGSRLANSSLSSGRWSDFGISRLTPSSATWRRKNDDSEVDQGGTLAGYFIQSLLRGDWPMVAQRPIIRGQAARGHGDRKTRRRSFFRALRRRHRIRDWADYGVSAAEPGGLHVAGAELESRNAGRGAV